MKTQFLLLCMFSSIEKSSESSSPVTLLHMNHSKSWKSWCARTYKTSGVSVGDLQKWRAVGLSCHRRIVERFSKGSQEGRSTSALSSSRDGHLCLSNNEIPLTNNLAEDIRDPALKVTVPESWHATSFRVKVWIIPSCSEISVTKLLWRGDPSSHHCTFFTPGCESSQVNVADSPTKTSVFFKPETMTASSSV